MKVFRWLAVIFLLCAGVLTTLGANAQSVDSIRQISLTGQGEVSTTPDMAEISMSVVSIKRASADAKTDVDTRFNNYLSALLELGIDKEDIVAATLRTNPQYSYQNNQRVFTGYSATRSIRITIDDLELLDAVMQSALDSKIDNIGQIEYKSSEEDELRAQARERAIQDSKNKAFTLAEAYDAELGPIHSISYYSSEPGPTPQFDRMQIESLSISQGASGEYLQDQLIFRDSIQVVFELIVSP